MKYSLPIYLMIVCCWNVVHRPVSERVLLAAESFVGIKEDQPNRGTEIDYWNSRLRLPPGSSYCASFVSFILDSAQVNSPGVRSGVAQHYIIKNSIPASKVISQNLEIPPGSLVIWKRGTSWMGHIGIVEYWKGAHGTTVEANTSSGLSGSQHDGDGIWDKQRAIIPTAYFRITHFTLIEN